MLHLPKFFSLFGKQRMNDLSSTMKQSICVVESTTAWVRYIVLKNSGQGQLTIHVERFLEKHSNEDQAHFGERVKQQSKQDILRGMLTVALLHPSDYQVYQTTGPSVESNKDLKASIKWKLKELTGSDPSEFTYDITPMGNAGGRLQHQILVSVVKNDLLQERIAQYSSFGFSPFVIRIAEDTISSILPNNSAFSASFASLFVSEHEFLISAVERGNIIMFRRIPRDMVAANESDTVSLRLVSEVVRSLDRLVRQFPEVPLDALFIDAGVETDAYLLAFRNEIQIPCDKMPVYSALEVAAHNSFVSDQQFSILVGCALGERNNKLSINLNNLSFTSKKELLPVNYLLGITVSFFVIALSYGMYSTFIESDLEAAHRSAKENHKIQLVDLSKKVTVVNGDDKVKLTFINNEINELKAVIGIMQLPSDKNLAFSEWLMQLSQRTPLGIALTSIDAQGTQYTLRGVTSSSAQLYSWVASLNINVLNNIAKFEVFDIHQIPDKPKGELTFSIRSSGVKL